MHNSNHHQQSTNDSRAVAIVTGGAQRIGRHIARALHQREINLVIHFNQSDAEATQLIDHLNQKRRHSAIKLQADLSTNDSVSHLIEQTVAHFGRLDYLINNASIFYPTTFLAANYESSLDQLVRVNLHTPINLLKEAQPYLIERRGAVVNLIDIYSRSGLSEHTAYVASKSGLLEATRQLALEFAPHVRVNGISPGAILWPENTPESEVSQYTSQRIKQQSIIANTALKRQGSADDISAAAVFLLLDASYITGQVISVDGGRQLYI